MEGDKYSVKFN